MVGARIYPFKTICMNYINTFNSKQVQCPIYMDLDQYLTSELFPFPGFANDARRMSWERKVLVSFLPYPDHE